MLKLIRVTDGPSSHFFGYYEKFPWNKSGEYMLALETVIYDSQPQPEDEAIVGVIDTRDGRWSRISSTRAWNWQQGSMLQWYPEDYERLLIFNDRDKNFFIARVFDITTGREVHRLSMPVYALDPKGRYALSLNFARLHRTRPGYGYAGVEDRWNNQAHPAEDGIYKIDLNTGGCKLIISLDQIYSITPEEDMEGVEHWVNHIQIATDGERFAFLHRWRKNGGFLTRMMTANPDGSDIRIITGDIVSHYDWKDNSHILSWAKAPNGGVGFFLFEDGSGNYEQIGKGKLTQDGHCSYSPNRDWILTDTYPDRRNLRTLILYQASTGERIDVAKFYSPSELTGPVRCDLHPRWSRDGKMICIDSAHEGDRQMYVLSGF